MSATNGLEILPNVATVSLPSIVSRFKIQPMHMNHVDQRHRRLCGIEAARNQYFGVKQAIRWFGAVCVAARVIVPTA